MKTLLLPFVFLGCFNYLFCQEKVDTLITFDRDSIKQYQINTYYHNGALKSSSYHSDKAKLLSKEEMFMRGLQNQNPGLKDYYPSVDSAYQYDENGVIQQARAIGPKGKTVFYDYEYDSNDNLGWVVIREVGQANRYQALERLLFDHRRQIIEGRIGEIRNVQIPISMKGEGPLSIQIRSSSKWIKVTGRVVLHPGKDTLIKMAVNFPSTVQDIELEMEDEKGHSFLLPITIMGYDLFGMDFDFSSTPELSYPLKNRRELIIKAEDAKLIRLYRDANLIDNYPTSRIRAEIDLKGFKKGDYLVEAVDFTANQKKYCRIRID